MYSRRGRGGMPGNSSGSRNRPSIMKANLNAWRREKVCVTKNVEEVLSKAKEENCVCVVGVAGSGKTTAMHYAAMKLEDYPVNQDNPDPDYQYDPDPDDPDKIFTIYSITDLDEFFHYLDKSKNQIFVLDDALGTYSISTDKIDKWTEHNEKVIEALSSNPDPEENSGRSACSSNSTTTGSGTTKLFLAVRTQLYNLQRLIGKDYICLDESIVVDFNEDENRLDIPDMKKMLKHFMDASKIENSEAMVDRIWPIQTEHANVAEKFSNCFPLLCKFFCEEEYVRRDPENFFNHPFSALIKIFQNMKTGDPHLFCGLVLCALYGGKLPEDTLSPLYKPGDKEKDNVKLRDLIMSSYKLKVDKDFEILEDALKSLVDVYLLFEDNEYKFIHDVFHDIVIYLFSDALFMFKFARPEFIRDRVRINRSHGDNDRPGSDPNMIKYSDDKNIGRLADRLIRDLKFPEKGPEFIANNPNIGDERLKVCLKDRFFDKVCLKDRFFDKACPQTDKQIINNIFEQCLKTVSTNIVTYAHKDVTQSNLIELCVQTRLVDCNMLIEGDLYPLHIAAMSGSVQLTDLLLRSGADKRRVTWRNGYSVLHCICRHTERNKLQLIKLLTQTGGDPSVVRVTSDNQKMLEALEQDNGDLPVYLEKVSSDNSVEFVTKDRQKMKSEIENQIESDRQKMKSEIENQTDSDRQKMKSEIENQTDSDRLQLVKHLHNDLLTYQHEWEKANVLHYSSNDVDLTRYFLGFDRMQQCMNQLDMNGMTPYMLIKHENTLGASKVALSGRERDDMMRLYEHFMPQDEMYMQ